MFNTEINLTHLNSVALKNMAEHLEIEFIEVGHDFLVAKMPVNDKTRQPFGILHGGASVALAETIGSMASFLCLKNPEKQAAVGLEINANHLRPAKQGWVFATCKNLHLGQKTHVWDIKITDEEKRLICISRLTVMVVEK